MTKDDVIEAFGEFAKEDFEEALALAIGIFVGITEAYLTNRGEDPQKEITFDGMGKRNITLHKR